MNTFATNLSGYVWTIKALSVIIEHGYECLYDLERSNQGYAYFQGGPPLCPLCNTLIPNYDRLVDDVGLFAGGGGGGKECLKNQTIWDKPS